MTTFCQNPYFDAQLSRHALVHTVLFLGTMLSMVGEIMIWIVWHLWLIRYVV